MRVWLTTALAAAPFLPLQPVVDENEYALCWSTTPIVETRNIFMSNVFKTQQTTEYLEKELAIYEENQGIVVDFKCEIGAELTEKEHFSRSISSISVRGFNISLITVKPH